MEREILHKVNGRLKILATKVQLTPPFFMGQTFSEFESEDELKEIMKCSCMIPVLGSILPRKFKNC